MHASIFSYNLSRPYPYRWFTPVVLVGGLLATVLFSVVNLAANGYQLQTVYVTDPNATISQKYWYTTGAFGLNSKLKSTCEPQNLLLGTQLFTSNLGLSYTITKIQHDGNDSPEPAVSYLNHTLEECQVDSVDVHLARADQSPPSSLDATVVNWWTWHAGSATASATCAVMGSSGKVNVTLSTTLNPTKRDYSYLLTIPTDSSSTWWATRVLNLYWVGLLWTMTYASTGLKGTLFDKSQFSFSLKDIHAMKSPALFNLDGFDFNMDDGGILNDQSLVSTNRLFNNATLRPNISATATEALGFAKAFYSLVLVDLGQRETPNLFLDEDLLKYALDAPDDIFRTTDSEWLGSDKVYTTLDANEYCTLCSPNETSCDTYVPMNQSYNAFKDQLGPLNTTAATIFMQYACSVPQARSVGTTFLSVLLADLVFLQALWTLFNLVTAWFMGRRFPNSNFCEGCLAREEPSPAEMGTVGYSDVKAMRSPLATPGLASKATSSRNLLDTSECDL